MERTLLDESPFEVDLVQLLEQFRVKEGSEIGDEIRELKEEACARGRPKALYKACLIEARGEDYVVFDGKHFRSRILAVNVEKVHRVFPFVATCGRELEEWSEGFEPGLKKFYADSIKGMALGTAVAALLDHMQEHHHPGEVSMMNPGSLEDWPLTEQKALFQVLGNTEEAIGVELMENSFMRPAMTTSGLWFPSQEKYENCMLCPMEDCPGRRAPYDKGFYDKKYRSPEEP